MKSCQNACNFIYNLYLHSKLIDLRDSGFGKVNWLRPELMKTVNKF